MLKLFKKKKKERLSDEGLGILVFEHTSNVIQAEKILKQNNEKIRVMGPPPGIQSGCDLVIQFGLMKKLTILRLLERENIIPLQAVPVTDPLLIPVDLFQTKDFGEFLMVRAANMKITIDKKNLMIVNISGGGCPDVPYLAGSMVGIPLEKAPNPRETGHTLCGYALGLAYEEIKKQCLQF
ncbi:MAG: DUF3343 domain-containing protein [Desulfobacteraceae bacterium]